MSLIRLDKFLSNSGIGTRSEVKKYLKQKRIWLDGKPILKGETKIDVSKNIVTFDKRVVSYEKYIYLIMNKPKDVVCSTKDPENKTVIDLLPNKYKENNLFSVGRLDKDTVGLLILTNDGFFAHNTLSPKKHVLKKYFAHINGEVDETFVKKFKQGIVINNGYKCLPSSLEILYSSKNFSKINIEIQEGKFHQIKKMFESMNRKVIFLKRIAFDKILLDENLKEGEFRHLNDAEMELISKYISKEKNK